MRLTALAALLGALVLSPCHAFALSDALGSWGNAAMQDLHATYDQGQSEVFIPGYSWHDPHTYTAAKRAQLNDWAIGLGWGRIRFDDAGNSEQVYALAFSDSHHDVEPVVGYAKQFIARPFTPNLRLGIGYTIGVTSRADTMKNFPFPIALPLLSIGYRRFTLYGTLIPRFNGSPNNGNVVFLFGGLRY